MADEARREVISRVVTDVGGAFATGLAYIGDRLGLFRALADSQALSSDELAQRLQLNERYVREWLKAMVSGGYIETDGVRYFMTPAEKAVLADESSPVFAAGAFQFALPSLGLTERLIACFREGGGIPYQDLGSEITEAIDRMHRPWFDYQLTGTWLPGVPGLADRLGAGIRILDVGCGLGRSSVAIAEAWPQCEIVGIDPDESSIARARRLAEVRGIPVTFEVVPVEDLKTSDPFDLVVAIDCIHDIPDPVGALHAIRRLLAPDGIFFWSEPAGSADPRKNREPVEKMRAGLSPYHCLTVSLAEGGRALGTIIGESGARALASEAGFRTFEKLPIDSRMQQFFVLNSEP